ncbi:hypothetical protein [Actinoplanes sp. NPDC049316]|uniref:hypothetical protein n=1 Tax=Actinoplanes sp. NPDC049316 TaxID=3154727 RepID=UPI0034482DD6
MNAYEPLCSLYGGPYSRAPEKKTGGGMLAFCASGIIGALASAVGQACIAFDRRGMGWYANGGGGMFYGVGIGGTVGIQFSNGNIEDQAGDAVGADVGGILGGKLDVNLSKSTSSNVYTGGANVGGMFGGGVAWAGGTNGKSGRWFDW